MKSSRVVAVVAVAFAVASACGTDDGIEADGSNGGVSSTAPSPYTSRASTELDFAETYDGQLAQFGVRVSRAGLTVSPSDKTYVKDGDHAAIYVTPITGADTTPEAYLERLPSIARIVVPDVFRRLRVTTVDLCQELDVNTGGGEYPPPETVLLVSRRQADALDWNALRLDDYVAMYEEGPSRASVLFSGRIRQTPKWRELTARA